MHLWPDAGQSWGPPGRQRFAIGEPLAAEAGRFCWGRADSPPQAGLSTEPGLSGSECAWGAEPGSSEHTLSSHAGRHRNAPVPQSLAAHPQLPELSRIPGRQHLQTPAPAALPEPEERRSVPGRQAGVWERRRKEKGGVRRRQGVFADGRPPVLGARGRLVRPAV
ncbi:hypothetical protein scyTo_0014487 [Scyliorhinus torazame]|uniref:Uncharacterized protein n=1 Tax=Scyliorhinus torazame TaxID=75743 RepID=A0A401NNC5_SCYTO|nr:hypothetical protein [Scyliorhinus torazame]